MISISGQHSPPLGNPRQAQLFHLHPGEQGQGLRHSHHEEFSGTPLLLYPCDSSNVSYPDPGMIFLFRIRIHTKILPPTGTNDIKAPEEACGLTKNFSNMKFVHFSLVRGTISGCLDSDPDSQSELGYADQLNPDPIRTRI